MSTTNVIKPGIQRVTALEQTREAKCLNTLHIQWVLEDANESIKYVPDNAPTVFRVESAGQATVILSMPPISRDHPTMNPTWSNGGAGKFHIINFFKNGSGTNKLKVGWGFTKPDGTVQGGAVDIDVSGISAGDKAPIIIMWDGREWRATDWFA